MMKNKRKSELDPREEVVHNIALATIALKDGNLEKSEKKFLNTLTLAEINNVYVGIIFICDFLSSVYMNLGNYEKAEDFLLQGLESLPKLGIPGDDNFVVNFNLKLSRLYSSNENDELAELSFKNCMEMQKKKLENSIDEETYILWMTILYWYGKFLIGKITIDRNLYEEASFWCVEGKKLARKFKNFGAEKESDECLKKIQKMFVTN
ncbi:conserved hypothetical protein [Pediculus humanus corporis]|uniref:Tetratricopeptide repeat protein n=1 Tax=Pediculus humanus subsp. corporis TaxID=121224 RepID=E0VER9_PEDHC|nr:uncharacterized protein Phum_PHUM137850 [Pediculus humanus corporis]EEB11875.1 conserved hypothetical protein [Pediculus humanus corporis]